MADKDDGGGKLDQILAHLQDSAKRFDAMEKRMDEMGTTMMDTKARMDAECAKWDAARKDAEDEKAKMDAARKDAEEKEKEEATKKDRARKDAEDEEAKMKAEEAKKDAARLDAAGVSAIVAAEIAKHVPKELADAERAVFVKSQVKFEPLYQAFGDTNGAPRFMSGETPSSYRKRLAQNFKQHSPQWKDIDLTTVHDSVLDIAEAAIINDAMRAALSPVGAPDGRLREVHETDHSGRKIIRFYGSEDACWKMFSNPDRKGRINTRVDRE